MPTVKELRERLADMPDDYEVVIYPKYSGVGDAGFNKYRFKIQNVCEQHPRGEELKNKPEELKDYLGGRNPESYEVEKHIAIIF